MRVLSLFMLFWVTAQSQDKLFKFQKPVKKYIVVTANGLSEQILLQTLSGIVSRLINEGKCDEIIWIPTGSPHYDKWLQLQSSRMALKKTGTMNIWQALKYFHKKKLISDFTLYAHKNNNENNEQVNIATSIASIKNSVAVEEKLLNKALAAGLTLVDDVRGKTIRWCFDKYRHLFNKNSLLTQSPKHPHHRAMAVSQNMLVFTGLGEVNKDIYKWLTPPASIMGFNAHGMGGEDRYIESLGDYGHICRVSDFSLNAPFLAMGSSKNNLKKPQKFSPSSINWNKKTTVAFTVSDGDNLQWTMGSFYNQDFWNSPVHGRFPIGFGMPLGALSEISPDIINYIKRTKPLTTSISLNGGYFYADQIGRKLTPQQRKQVLITIAQRINQTMERAPSSSLIIFVKKHDSSEAQQAYKIFTENIPNATGFFIVQYAPYHAGHGKIYWNKNKNGVHIPAITCSEIIWANMTAKGAGTPAKVAHTINNKGPQAFSWVMLHAWSKFQKIKDNDLSAENPESHKQLYQGLEPLSWCIDRIDRNKVNVVCPDELLWRIRKQYYPAETEKIINRN